MASTISSGLTNWLLGQNALPPLPPPSWFGLLNAAGQEPLGNSYARQQISGSVVTSALTTAGLVIHVASVPAWLIAGMLAADATNPAGITPGTYVVSTTSTTITMSANVTVASGDTILFSLFALPSPASGSEPNTTPAYVTNSAAVVFPTAGGAGWGTLISWGLFSTQTMGTPFLSDYLGQFPWLPATLAPGNPALFTSPAHGFLVGTQVVVEILDSNPIIYQVLTVPSADTFTLNGLNANNFTAGRVRRLVLLSVPNGFNPTFSAGSLKMSLG